MAATHDALIQAINDQLIWIRVAIQSTSRDADERLALEAFQQELTAWQRRLTQQEEHHQVDPLPGTVAQREAADNTLEHVQDEVSNAISTLTALVPNTAVTPAHFRKRRLNAETEQPSAKHVKKEKAVVKYECAVCLDSFRASDIHTIYSCRCHYCLACFVQMLQNALDVSEVVRCCNRNVKFPKALANSHGGLSTQYETLYRQLDADNPMYCAAKTCSAFLGNYRRLKHKVTCKTCKTESCAACRQLMSEHLGIHKLCKEDVEDAVLKEAVDQYHLKRCPRCMVIVEKNGGCNNIR